MTKNEFTEKLIEILDLLGCQKAAKIEVIDFQFKTFEIDGKPFKGKFLNQVIKIIMTRLKKYSGKNNCPKLDSFNFYLDCKKRQYLFQNLSEKTSAIIESY